MRQGLLLGGLGALVFIGVAIATLPASLLIAHLPPELHCEGASGTLWSGEAESVAVRGVPLGLARWHAEPAALLGGRLAYRVELARPDGWARGRLSTGLDGTLRVEAVELRLPLGALGPEFAANAWRGVIAGAVEHAVIEGGWPVDLSAHLQISELQPPGAGLAIGAYAIDFDAGARNPTQLVGRVRDLEAPLTVRAQLLLRRDHSYALEGELTLRPATPPEMSNAIAFLGRPDAAGRRSFALTGTY